MLEKRQNQASAAIPQASQIHSMPQPAPSSPAPDSGRFQGKSETFSLGARGALPYFAMRLAQRMGSRLDIQEPAAEQMSFTVSIPNQAG